MPTMSRSISRSPKPVYVWIWLPGQTEPIVAGVITTSQRNGAPHYGFRYAPSYLARPDRISLYAHELPLPEALTSPPQKIPSQDGLAGCLRDAMPDAWGRRVIVNQLTGARRGAIDTDMFDETIYMMHSGSDRIGALDFQASPTDYEARDGAIVTLDDLAAAIAYVEAGEPIPHKLGHAAFHSNSIGGARPKSLADIKGGKALIKFPSSTDVFPVLKGEFVAMRLAHLAGMDVAPVGMVQIGKMQALAIERFDRTPSATHRGAWERRGMVSALTALGLTDMTARYASYEDLAATIRQSHAYPQTQLAELFGRISFNILCGNTDDHARNTALFWDGAGLRLTPAYDICPQSRTGQIASQAMAICGDDRSARLTTCLRAASSFLLGQAEAKAVIDRQIDTIRTYYTQVCDEAGMGSVERDSMWGRQFLNPFAFEEWPDSYPLAQTATSSYPEP